MLAPADEPAGYAALAGYAKTRPENNEFYLAQYAERPYYKLLRETHEKLERLIPGYNINQIKVSFQKLSYEISWPSESNWQKSARTQELVSKALAEVNGVLVNPYDVAAQPQLDHSSPTFRVSL